MRKAWPTPGVIRPAGTLFRADCAIDGLRDVHDAIGEGVATSFPIGRFPFPLTHGTITPRHRSRRRCRPSRGNNFPEAGFSKHVICGGVLSEINDDGFCLPDRDEPFAS